MGQAKEIKEKIYGDFLKWLKTRAIEDCFSMDVWMSKAFDKLYEQFKLETENSISIGNFIDNAPIEILEKILADKQKKIKEKKLDLIRR